MAVKLPPKAGIHRRPKQQHEAKYRKKSPRIYEELSGWHCRKCGGFISDDAGGRHHALNCSEYRDK